MFDLEQGAHISPVNVVASRQVRQQVEDVQRDVYDSHRHRAFALAFYMTGNELEAEEIMTRAFVQAFRAIDEPQAHDVDTALIEELRQRFPLDQNESPVPVSPESSRNLDLDNENVRRTDLEEAIQVLPVMERLLFLLRDVEGYAPAAISQLMGIPESQVHRTLFSARIRLRHELAATRADRREAA